MGVITVVELLNVLLTRGVSSENESFSFYFQSDGMKKIVHFSPYTQVVLTVYCLMLANLTCIGNFIIISSQTSSIEKAMTPCSS